MNKSYEETLDELNMDSDTEQEDEVMFDVIIISC